MAVDSWPRARADEVLKILKELVSIPSVNPSLVPGGSGEAEAARFLAGTCERLGMRVEIEEVAPGRPNVVAVLPGRDPGRGRCLLLNGHMDTVGDAGMVSPYSPVVTEDRLYGRGAYDMKGGLAAMVGAVDAVLESGVRPLGDVVLTFVADEEYASLGTAAIARRWRGGAAIVTEPTALAICVAHKGFAWATITTRGRAAHGSEYAVGVDAIANMGRVLAALERLDREVLPTRPHPLLGRPSVHASRIIGGEGWSTYPPSCMLEIERRMLPSESAAEVSEELEELLNGLRREDPSFQASFEISLARPGLQVGRQVEIVRTLHRAIESETGGDPRYIGLSAWFDAALLAQAGLPAVIFGPGGAGAHAEVEYVEVPSVLRCADVLARVILDYSGA